MDSHSVDLVVTSVPYFQKRIYDAVDVYGGLDFCNHDWKTHRYYTEVGTAQSSHRFHAAGEENAKRLKAARWKEDTHCKICGAWKGELGWEASPDEFVQHLTLITAEIKRVLRPDGICFLNIGDTYNSSRRLVADTQPGSLFLIPERLSLALLKQGWAIRNSIKWYKTKSTPEPRVKNRCVSTHETILMLVKSSKYQSKFPAQTPDTWITESITRANKGDKAKMHEEIVARCIQCGLKELGVVLDPFAGSGTTLSVAEKLGHSAIGIELNQEDYHKLQEKFGTLQQTTFGQVSKR
ncbi:DNA-methyltransferase [Leptolyngbya sp. AN03gr2]|uniref:DNA-methyltransferase n=1 Tax=Leptolyngbya sp. AN03gr2 TaxID=3423364 RepID=UPI003D322CE3